MAITALDYVVLRSMRRQNILREGASMLETGESNWYGDLSLEELARDIGELVNDSARRDGLLAQLRATQQHPIEQVQYELAKIFFQGIGGFDAVASIDPGTSGSDYKFDLNQPVPLQRQFGVLINYGTGEHIFNVCQFYKTVHELTSPSGIMIHQAPMTGWVEHGFYTFQPTFFFDLARANAYELLAVVVGSLKPFRIIQVTHRDHVIEIAQRGELPDNAMIEVVMKQAAEKREFRVPMQGYYAGVLDAKGADAWRTLR